MLEGTHGTDPMLEGTHGTDPMELCRGQVGLEKHTRQCFFGHDENVSLTWTEKKSAIDVVDATVDHPDLFYWSTSAWSTSTVDGRCL